MGAFFLRDEGFSWEKIWIYVTVAHPPRTRQAY